MVFVSPASPENVFRFFLLFLLVASRGVAQENCPYTMKGTVVDISTGEPLPFVSIRVMETSSGTISGPDGSFVIENICLPEVHLEFSYIGYKTITHHHDVHHQVPVILLAPEEMELDGIVVEGERIDVGRQTQGSISISGETIRRFGISDFSTVAGKLEGLSLISTGQNIQKPVLHGLHGNRILIMNNGVRHEYQNWGEDHAPEIDLSGAEEITVVKGAATVKYGPDALGGVILINPPDLELHQRFKGEAGLSVRSNGRGLSGHTRMLHGLDRWSFVAEGTGVLQGDLNAPDFNLTNTGKQEWSMATGVRFHQPNFDLYGYYSHFAQNLSILRGSVNGNLNDLVLAMNSVRPLYTRPFSRQINSPRQETSHDLAKVQAKIYGVDQLLDIQYAFQFNQRQEFDVRRGSNNDVPSIHLHLATQTLDINWEHPSWRRLQGEMGASWLYQDNNNIPGTNTVPFVPNFNNMRVGGYIIESLQLSDQQLIEGGVRFDYQFSSVRGREPDNSIYRHELTYSNLTASFGYKYDISNELTFRTHIGTAWRPPSISELYRYGKHQAAIEYGFLRYLETGEVLPETDEVLSPGDKNIESEKGWKWIGSIEKHSQAMRWLLSTYFQYIQNYIYATPRGITQNVRGAFPFYTYQQTDAVVLGADATIQWKWSERWSQEMGSSFVWVRDVGDGQYFAATPPLSFRNEVEYTFGRKKFKHSIVGEGSYTFTQFLAPRVISPEAILAAAETGKNLLSRGTEIFDFAPPPEGYFLVGLGWVGQWKRWTTSLKFNNLLNNTYRVYTDRLRYFAPDTGLNIIASLKYRW